MSDTSVTLSPLRLPAPELGKGVYRIQPRLFLIQKIERVALWAERTDPGAGATRTLGIIGGVIVGAVAGGAIAQGSGGYLDFDYIPGGIVGGGLGGLLGAEIGGSMTMDTVVFDPKIPVQRDSLRLFVPGE